MVINALDASGGQLRQVAGDLPVSSPPIGTTIEPGLPLGGQRLRDPCPDEAVFGP